MRGKQSSKISLKKRLLKRRQAMTKRWGKQRTRRPPKADGAHVCRPRSIFFAAHVAEENDWTFFAPAGANSTRFYDKLSKPPRFSPGRFAESVKKYYFLTKGFAA